MLRISADVQLSAGCIIQEIYAIKQRNAYVYCGIAVPCYVAICFVDYWNATRAEEKRVKWLYLVIAPTIMITTIIALILSYFLLSLHVSRHFNKNLKEDIVRIKRTYLLFLFSYVLRAITYFTCNVLY